MIDWHNRTLIAGAAAVLISGFCVGFLTAKATNHDGSKALPIAGSELAGPATGLFGKPRDKNAPRAGETRPAGFDTWKQRLDTTGDTPKACVQFSKALDPSKPYGDYVVVSPALPSAPAVKVKGDELCVSGFGFTDRRVTLLKGLPGKGNDALKANKDFDFSFGEKPAYVGFKGSGVVLPREEADGVAIETVNVSALSVEVWHVSDRNLVRKSVSAPDPVAEGEYDYGYGDDAADDIGVKIWTGKLGVKTGNGDRVTTVFPLGSVLKSLKAGAYVVKVRDASGGRDKKTDDEPAQARRWIIYTDMALTTYKGQSGMDVVVRSLKSAKPMTGVKVDLVAANGDTLAEGHSGIDGRVTFAGALLKGTDALQAKMVMAYGPNDDYTAVDVQRSPMDLTQHGVGGRQDDEGSVADGRANSQGVDGYMYTDRGIYRPGETVHVVALIRDNEGKAIKDRKGAVIVTRPSGVEAFRFAFDKTPQGYAGANIALAKTAPRGQWSAKIMLDGMDTPSGTVSFAVEDFAPQRLGVDVEADSDKPLLSLTDQRPVHVTARYLYGAVGSDLQVTGEARIRQDANPFPAFKDYQFGDSAQPFEEKYVDLPGATTDAQGNALFPFDASLAGTTTQPLTVLVTASVFEPGGRPVKESQTLRIKPSPLYLGIKVDQKESRSWRDTPQVALSVIGVTPQGQKTAVKGAVVKLIAEHWDYDWYISDGRWNWRSTHRDVLVSTKTVDLNGNTGYTFQRGLDWGDYRLEVEVPGKARSVARFGSGWGSSQSGADAPDVVRLSTGGKHFNQGDSVDITLKAPYKGEAQIAVATDHVIEMKTVSVGEGGTTVRLKSSSAWGGGAYVMVSVIQPRDPVTASKPRRAVGLIYVPLDAKSRKLQVSIPISDKPFKPQVDKAGKGYIEVPVKIDGAKLGDHARVSLAVVDQGILNLTKFQTPDPINWYFGKRALGVDYNDDYGRLLDPNLGAPAQVFGADQIGGEGLTTTPIRTVALWSGVIETGFDGRATVKLPISKFNGELRVMAVAWTDDAVGSSQQKLVVREPVVMDLALPRFLNPGDKAFATLELDNVDGKPGLYQVLVKGLQGLVMAFEKAFNLGHGQRVIQSVPMLAPHATGISTVHIGMNGQGYKFDDDFQIQTRNGWGPETRTWIEQQPVNGVYSPPAALLAGLQPGSVTVEVSYSPYRNIDPGPLAAALNKYPYGCTEQVTSAATPWLYVDESIVGKERARPAANALKTAVQKLLDRQSEDGAIGLWSVGDGEADGFIGAYATDFLLEARARGVYVPQEAIDKALNAMREMSKPGSDTSINYRLSVPGYWMWFGISSEEMTKQLRSRASAYSLYVLAKAKSGDLARLRWYHDVQFKEENSPLARAQVAAGLAMMGDRARARLAFREAIDKLGYDDRNDWYQTPLRDLAGVIALAYEAGFPDIGASLAPRLENAMKSVSQLNTQEDAFILKAASYMLKAAGPTKIAASGVSTLPGGMNVQRFGVTKLASAQLKNVGAGAIWRTVTVIGTPMAPPAAQASGLSLSKSFYALNGQRIDPSHLTQGDRIIVVISGHSDRAETRPIVVDDALPAGFEIDSTLTSQDTQNGPFRFVGELTGAQVQEARDDRFIAAMDVSSSKDFTVAYIARAVTQGDYYLPGVEAKDFYRPEVYGRTAGSRMVISAR